MMFKIETERLVLRELVLTDAHFILQLFNTKGWLEFIGDRGVNADEDAKKYLEDKLIPSYKKNGFGFYLAQLKDTGIPIGICGLVKREGLEHTDLGFAFMPQFNQMGYAYESSVACLDFAKNKLSLKKLLAITLPANSSCIKLLKKLNFKFDKIIQMKDDPDELMLFEITI